MKDNCPRRGFGPRGPKTRGGTLGLPALYRGRLAKRECGYFRLIITKKNLDLIACTAARYQRFSRKWSWAANKKTRARTFWIGVFDTSFVLVKQIEGGWELAKTKRRHFGPEVRISQLQTITEMLKTNSPCRKSCLEDTEVKGCVSLKMFGCISFMPLLAA